MGGNDQNQRADFYGHLDTPFSEATQLLPTSTTPDEDEKLIYDEDNWDIIGTFPKPQDETLHEYYWFGSPGAKNEFRSHGYQEVEWHEPESDTTSSFTPFLRLPIELRLQIWKYALPAPRLVEFRMNVHETPSTEPIYIFPETHYRVNVFLQSGEHFSTRLMHVCRESRSYFMENYTSGFSIYIYGRRSESQDVTLYHIVRGTKTVVKVKLNTDGYIDVNRDTLIISETNNFRRVARAMLDIRFSVQKVAVSIHWAESRQQINFGAIALSLRNSWRSQKVLRVVEKFFPRLKQFTFVPSHRPVNFTAGQRPQNCSWANGRNYLRRKFKLLLIDDKFESVAANHLSQLKDFHKKDLRHLANMVILARLVNDTPFQNLSRRVTKEFWRKISISSALLVDFDDRAEGMRDEFCLLKPKPRNALSTTSLDGHVLLSNTPYYMVRPQKPQGSTLHSCLLHEHFEFPCDLDGEMLDERYRGIRELFERGTVGEGVKEIGDKTKEIVTSVGWVASKVD